MSEVTAKVVYGGSGSRPNFTGGFSREEVVQVPDSVASLFVDRFAKKAEIEPFNLEQPQEHYRVTFEFTIEPPAEYIVKAVTS